MLPSLSKTTLQQWKLPRPFVKYLFSEERLGELLGRKIIVFEYTEMLHDVISIGDEVQLVDVDDLQPWITGTVNWVIKTCLRDMPIQSAHNWLTPHFLGTTDIELIARKMSEYYGVTIDTSHEITAIGLSVTHTNYPIYKIEI